MTEPLETWIIHLRFYAFTGAAGKVLQTWKVPDQNSKPEPTITTYVFGMYMHRY